MGWTQNKIKNTWAFVIEFNIVNMVRNTQILSEYQYHEGIVLVKRMLIYMQTNFPVPGVV